MTDTYGDLKTRIADEILRSDLSSQIVLAITSAIARHQRRRFWFNTKTGTFSTVAAQEYYSSTDLSDIPNILALDSVTITADSTTAMRVVSFEDIDDVQDGSVTGDPYFLALYKQNLRLYPVPNAVRTITLAYVYRLTALSADTDSNAWTTVGDAEELIRASAKADLYANILFDDAKAASCGTQEARALSELLDETKQRRSRRTPRLEVAGMTGGGGSSWDINAGY